MEPLVTTDLSTCILRTSNTARPYSRATRSCSSFHLCCCFDRRIVDHVNKPGTLFRFGALALVWGSSFLWIKIALTGLSPVQIAVLRTGLGAAVIVALVYARGHRLPRSR